MDKKPQPRRRGRKRIQEPRKVIKEVGPGDVLVRSREALGALEDTNGGAATLPPVLLGHGTPAIARAVGQFYMSVDVMFTAWIRRTENQNTQRAYRQDVMSFVGFQQIRWPEEADQLLKVSVPDVLAWRDWMQRDLAPKTLNRRISSLSSFFTFMRETAAASKLPIIVANPAHSQFIGRESKDIMASI